MAGTIRNDLSGMRFGSLSVVGRSANIGNGKKPTVKWECICVCGKITAVKGYSLTSGHTVSCGCKKIKHGYSHKERLYQTWQNMRRRCMDPTNNRWNQYGGKGISICLEWNEYSIFRAWAMANGYRDNLSIDRIDNNGNYCPENCRWADAKTQTNNCSRNRILEYNGQRFTMAQMAEYLGLTYSALQHRVDRGQTIPGVTVLP